MNRAVVSFLVLGVVVAIPARAQAPDPGRQAFEVRCSRCHGADGNGGEMGPAIGARLSVRDDAALAAFIRTGLPARGMPPQDLPDPEMRMLVAHLRTLERRESPPPMRTVRTTAGRDLSGRLLGEGVDDLQLRTDDGRVHLLRKEGDRFREVTSEVSWPTYNGGPGGNRYTTLTGIDKTNVGRLAPAWIFAIPGAGGLQVTPIVVDGLMYVTLPNECYALDAGSGRVVWRFQRPRTTGQTSGGGANRGAAVAGERLFMETDDAHVIALNRFTGAVLWDAPLDDWRKNYSASSAPLPAGDLVISGVSGGEHGANGFVAAHDQATGREVWRFWTVPKPGQPGSETWQGKDIEHGGAPTWFTGTYDPALDLVYWPVGNPSKEYNGDDRGGDNLYSDSILALDRKTGALKWHYQFTPHDLWDWDATETPMLIDADWQGQPRRLLVQANRNGFLYVFDRATGALLRATPFVRNLTWAKGIGADGRPITLPNQVPTLAGTLVCPSQDGATNWFSPSFNPATGLLYVQTFEKCSLYTKQDGAVWEPGKTYLGGVQRTADTPTPQRILKAIDLSTGRVRWELPQPGPANSWGGTIATAAGLVFFGDESGAFVAADAVTGARRWSFPTNQNWRASPMTYQFDGRQYVGVVAGGTVMAFAVPR